MTRYRRENDYRGTASSSAAALVAVALLLAACAVLAIGFGGAR